MAIRLQRQSVANQSISLEPGEKHVHVLGPELTLQDCDLSISCSLRGIILKDVDLVDCRIVAKKPLRNWQHWCGVRVRNCTFIGEYIGNDFGHWEDQSEFGSIEACDFSQASLHECRLFDCEVSTMTFASWPTFIITDPCGHKKESLAAKWPKEFEMWAELAFDEDSIVGAAIYNADRIVDDEGGNAAELRDLLTSLPFVIGAK